MRHTQVLIGPSSSLAPMIFLGQVIHADRGFAVDVSGPRVVPVVVTRGRSPTESACVLLLLGLMIPDIRIRRCDRPGRRDAVRDERGRECKAEHIERRTKS